jgi:glycosyltransferase involved in cell wall biosynthesis
VLIRAVGDCVRGGLDAELTIIGDGRYRAELENLASSECIADRVTFAGHAASPTAVRDYLDTADVFVLASRQEGLPRAMIEAMARGLPCIGSRVGGIPELLAPEDLVASGSVRELADKIREFSSSTERLSSAGLRNYRTAEEYREDALSVKRHQFYREVKRLTLGWLHRGTSERLEVSA